jgi:hypothetical protein
MCRKWSVKVSYEWQHGLLFSSFLNFHCVPCRCLVIHPFHHKSLYCKLDRNINKMKVCYQIQYSYIHKKNMMQQCCSFGLWHHVDLYVDTNMLDKDNIPIFSDTVCFSEMLLSIMSLHGVITQKNNTVIFSTVKTSNITRYKLLLKTMFRNRC